MLLFWQGEEKCARLQASLSEAEDKLSSKFPANGSVASTTSATAADTAAATHVGSLFSSSLVCCVSLTSRSYTAV